MQAIRYNQNNYFKRSKQNSYYLQIVEENLKGKTRELIPTIATMKFHKKKKKKSCTYIQVIKIIINEKTIYLEIGTQEICWRDSEKFGWVKKQHGQLN